MSTRSLDLRAAAATVLFLALLVAPLAGQLLSAGRAVSESERRALAPPPAIADAVADWPAFPARVSAWMNDHFGFRAALIRLSASARRELGLEDESRAVRGDDGWLFAAIGSALAMHEGLRPFALGEAEAWLDRLADLRDDAEAGGAAFVVFIPPNKHSVYGEYLSAHPQRVAGEGRLDALVRRAPGRGLALTSPRDALVAAKAREKVYYETDTHWTDYGAYVGYRVLMDAIAAQGVAAPVLDEPALTRTVRDDFSGDLYGLLGVEEGTPETVARLSVSAPTPVAAEEALPDWDFRSFRARRFVMAPRETGPGVARRPRLLLIGDSFANGLAPYLKESFGEVTMVHHQFGAVPADLIEPGRYDVVVVELVERILTYKPREAADAP